MLSTCVCVEMSTSRNEGEHFANRERANEASVHRGTPVNRLVVAGL